MPTKRQRHSITETPPVERALRRLRRVGGGAAIDLKELVILGAEEKIARLEREGEGSGRSEAVEAFLALRAEPGIDAEAGLELHESGWARSR